MCRLYMDCVLVSTILVTTGGDCCDSGSGSTVIVAGGVRGGDCVTVVVGDCVNV